MKSAFTMPIFKGDDRHESRSTVIGLVVLILGIIILMVGFVMAFNIASNPAEFMRSQLPEDTQQIIKGPRAEFRFTVTDLNVTFEDASESGDGSIMSWDWDFGDGFNSNEQNPQHTYSMTFNGNVRLTVRDTNNKESSALGSLQAESGLNTTGNSMPDISDFGSMFDFGMVLDPIMNVLVAAASGILVFFMLFVVWLVGASITKAGWNMIRPRPETIRVRIKPKDLEVEPVYPTTYATQPQSHPQPQPPPPNQPPAQEEAPPPPE